MALQAPPTTCPGGKELSEVSGKLCLSCTAAVFLLLPKELYNLISFLSCSGFQEAERNLKFNIGKFLFALRLFSFCQKELHDLCLSFACNARNFNGIQFIIGKLLSCQPPVIVFE